MNARGAIQKLSFRPERRRQGGRSAVESRVRETARGEDMAGKPQTFLRVGDGGAELCPVACRSCGEPARWCGARRFSRSPQERRATKRKGSAPPSPGGEMREVCPPYLPLGLSRRLGSPLRSARWPAFASVEMTGFFGVASPRGCALVWKATANPG